MLTESIYRPLRKVKYAVISNLTGPHGSSAVATSIPHGERTWEYPWVLQTIGRLSQGEKLKILDVGCGPQSILPLWLSTLGHEVWGCDLRPPITDFAGTNYTIGDITKSLDLPSDFDLAISISVIEHVGLGKYPGDSTESGKSVLFLKSMAKHVKSCGRVLLTFPFGQPGYSRDLNRIDACRIRNLQETAELLAKADLTPKTLEIVSLSEGRWKPIDPTIAEKIDSTVQIVALGGLVAVPNFLHTMEKNQ